MPEQTPVNLEREPILSFEEFSARDEYDKPRYKNFFWHFMEDDNGDIYRRNKYYTDFAENHVDLEDKLMARVAARVARADQSKGGIGEALKPIDAELYEAYKIMREYGATDQDLFT